MRVFSELLEKIRAWVRAYSELTVLLLAVALLAVGWLAGLLAADEQTESWPLLLEMLAAVGTVAAAIAAWRAIILTRAEQKRQINKENEQNKPNLIMYRSSWPTLYTAEFELINLSPLPVFVRFLVQDEYAKQEPKMDSIELLIPPGGSASHGITTMYFHHLDKGEFRYFFQYGATGLTHHRLAFPYKAGGKYGVPDNLMNMSIVLLTGQQGLAFDLGTDIANGRTLLERVFED